MQTAQGLSYPLQSRPIVEPPGERPRNQPESTVHGSLQPFPICFQYNLTGQPPTHLISTTSRTRSISAYSVVLNLIVCHQAGKLHQEHSIMPRNGYWDIDPFLVNNTNPATRSLGKPGSRTPLTWQPNLNPSFESIVEINIAHSPLDCDPEISRLMSPAGSCRQSRQEVLSFPSTLRAIDPASFESIYDGDEGYRDHYEIPMQGSRPQSLLPNALFEYQHTGSYRNNPSVYSAHLHTASWSSNQSTFCSEPDQHTASHSPSLLPPSPPPSHPSHTLQRNKSFAKRSVTPLQLEKLRSTLDREEFPDEVSRCSSEALPSTPTSSCLPSISFSSTVESSPSSVMTSTSAQDMVQTHAVIEHTDEPEKKGNRKQPRRPVLGDTQTRVAQAMNISLPIPSPTYPNANTAAERSSSYHWAPSSRSHAPSPAPTLTAEVSVFDPASDDDEGKLSHRLKTVRSAVSLNLRNQSRARANSSTRPPPMPSTTGLAGGRTSDPTSQLSRKGSVKLRSSKESKQATSPTMAFTSPASSPTYRVTSNGTTRTSYHSAKSNANRASSEAETTTPAARLRKKMSVRSKRSNTASSTSSPPTPPPNTPLPPTPRLTSTAAKRQSRISWYSCFSRAENTEAAAYVAEQRKQRRSKTSTKTSSPGRVRVFFTRILRLKK